MLQEEVETAVKELLSLKDRPDAIFVAGERLTIGCLQVLKKIDPATVTIAGFSNSDVPDLFQPAITSVFQPAIDMGQLATKKLLELIEAKYPVTEFGTQVLQTRLFIR
jgi:LacI family transcriptional regulator